MNPSHDTTTAMGALACTIAGIDGTADLHVMMNMFWEALTFELPAGAWRIVIDTFASGPADMPDESSFTIQDRWPVEGRSITVVEVAPATPNERSTAGR